MTKIATVSSHNIYWGVHGSHGGSGDNWFDGTGIASVTEQADLQLVVRSPGVISMSVCLFLDCYYDKLRWK